MTGNELREEGQRLSRPCVWLRDTGPKEDVGAVWGGPGIVPAPKGSYRHWLTIDCWCYKEFLHRYGSKIGPTDGCLSVYTDDEAGGVAVHDRKAKLAKKRGGTMLYAHSGRWLPPIDAVFRFGGPAVQKWLKANKWKPEWGYNNNFKDKTPAQEYERHYQQFCPLHSITGDNDSEGDNKTQEEAGDGYGLIMKQSLLIHRQCFVVIRKGIVVVAVDDCFIIR